MYFFVESKVSMFTWMVSGNHMTTVFLFAVACDLNSAGREGVHGVPRPPQNRRHYRCVSFAAFISILPGFPSISANFFFSSLVPVAFASSQADTVSTQRHYLARKVFLPEDDATIKLLKVRDLASTGDDGIASSTAQQLDILRNVIWQSCTRVPVIDEVCIALVADGDAEPPKVEVQITLLNHTFVDPLLKAQVLSSSTFCTELTIWPFSIEFLLRSRSVSMTRPYYCSYCTIPIWRHLLMQLRWVSFCCATIAIPTSVGLWSRGNA